MQMLIHEAVEFLHSVGIETETTSEPRAGTFVPGVWLDHGRLILHMETAHVCDLLHEAGHLATVPSEFRSLVRPGDFLGPLLQKAVEKCLQERDLNDCNGVEDPTVRGVLQMGECEATAWSFAATRCMQISPEVLILPREDGTLPYETMEAAEDVLEMLLAGRYFGIHGLQAAKFCTVRSFPKMRHWLAP